MSVTRLFHEPPAVGTTTEAWGPVPINVSSGDCDLLSVNVPGQTFDGASTATALTAALVVV